MRFFVTNQRSQNRAVRRQGLKKPSCRRVLQFDECEPRTLLSFSGAIYTTMPDGMTVNANIYTSADQVYLNGGPQNTNGSKLPDGTYYFEVTDPSGATLLSTDPAVDRQLVVSNGVVDGVPATPPTDPNFTGFHSVQATANPNGSVAVQLVPFATTPDAGGEYKVWLIAQTATTSIDTTDPRIVHFFTSDAKTDAFKVLPDPPADPSISFPTVSGVKFYDTNTDGVQDNGEQTIAGWQINVLKPDGTTDTFLTDSTGAYSFVADENGLYTVYEGHSTLGNWMQTGPIPGARAGSAQSPATADSSREWTFTVNTNLASQDNITGISFGNVCLGQGGGLTLGFWSNKNGQAIMSAGSNVYGPYTGIDADLAFLRNLNLKNADGSDFNPTTYSSYRNWLLNATATNMAYMLSVQLATMELNVRHGYVSGGDMVLASSLSAFSPAGLNTNGFMSVNDLMTDVNTELGLPPDTSGNSHSLVLAGNPYRAYQQALETLVDRLNNNDALYVESTPCAFSFSSFF